MLILSKTPLAVSKLFKGCCNALFIRYKINLRFPEWLCEVLLQNTDIFFIICYFLRVSKKTPFCVCPFKYNWAATHRGSCNNLCP